MGIFFTPKETGKKDSDTPQKERSPFAEALKRVFIRPKEAGDKQQKEPVMGGAAGVREKIWRAFFTPRNDVGSPAEAKEPQEDPVEQHLREYGGFAVGQKVFVKKNPVSGGGFESDWTILDIIYDKENDRFVFTVGHVGNIKRVTYQRLSIWQNEGRAAKTSARQERPREADAVKHPAEYRGYHNFQEVAVKEEGRKYTSKGWIIVGIAVGVRGADDCTFTLRNNIRDITIKASYRDLNHWQQEVQNRARAYRYLNVYDGMVRGDDVVAPKGDNGLQKVWQIIHFINDERSDDCIVELSSTVDSDSSSLSFEDLKKLQDDYAQDLRDLFRQGKLASQEELSGLGAERITTIQERYREDTWFAKKVLGLSPTTLARQLTLAKIKHAYRKLVTIHHPDRNGSSEVAEAVHRLLQQSKALLDSQAVDARRRESV